MEEITFDQFTLFHCAGSDCPYTCCALWKIFVDAKTEKFYQSCEGEFGEYLRKNLVHIDGRTMMRLDDDGRCMLLNEDGLCRIQLEYGEGALCNTCATYPRQEISYENTTIYSMALSCPEVARELLERKSPLHILRKTVKTPPDMEADSKEKAELWEIRHKAFNTAIRILQDRDCDIVQRQRLFLLMSQAVQEAIDAEKPHLAQKVLSVFSVPEEYRKLAADVNVASSAVSKVQLLKKLSGFIFKEDGSYQLRATTELAIQYLQSEKADLDAFAAFFGTIKEKKRQQEMENILLGFLPGNYCSEFGDENLFYQAAYVVFLTQLYRVLSAVGYVGGERSEDAQRDPVFISYIARAFEQRGSGIRDRICQSMEEQGLFDLGYLFQLIA